MLKAVQRYASGLFNLFYPHTCVACGQALLAGENVVCYRCVADMPETGFWKDSNNRLAQRFWGRVTIQGAAALYRFNKGSGVQQLIHELKYRGRKDVGEYAGRLTGHRLLEEGSVIKNIDLVVPVPLHWKKQRQRGYNQCDYFASGIAEVLGKPWLPDAVIRNSENVSQTQMDRFERWVNVASIFSIQNPAALSGKHILLVDDVMTTGATAEACLQAILSVPGTTASFVAIAAAENQ